MAGFWVGSSRAGFDWAGFWVGCGLGWVGLGWVGFWVGFSKARF